MNYLEFEVIWGVNNIYSILELNSKLIYEGIFKGKVLETGFKEYSPLVPGDIVLGYIYGSRKVYIDKRLNRRNILWRYNKKADLRQTIVSNIDNVLIVSSANFPEMKNFFIDRVLIVAEEQNIVPIIVINKIDKGISQRAQEFSEIYENLGYKVLKTSVKTFEGIEEVKEVLKNTRTSFIGQSGVGKSSLINLIDSRASQSVNEISHKYSRGKHTTVYSISFHSESGIIVDTPGIKEFGIETLPFESLKYYFKEFENFASFCKYKSCLHVSEPCCFVTSSLGNGISKFRYESYLKILSELKNYKNYAG
ncbi:ribosome small subunit-dependent GTPase A [Borreliella andersonii]|uniref:Small ribosomal subunit biogenesis GTPase RsgA n=1 Tax=Borrelia andersonii TaxID=42109 RepID=A0ABZ0CKJ0_BORAD|nr:ribosome small subunit-dependent GTPase A [Borreliella andersonii]WNY65584.1 ribosome small subunit-dependent GTPase A [Borreliella andersonii]